MEQNIPHHCATGLSKFKHCSIRFVVAAVSDICSNSGTLWMIFLGRPYQNLYISHISVKTLWVSVFSGIVQFLLNKLIAFWMLFKLFENIQIQNAGHGVGQLDNNNKIVHLSDFDWGLELKQIRKTTFLITVLVVCFCLIEKSFQFVAIWFLLQFLISFSDELVFIGDFVVCLSTFFFRFLICLGFLVNFLIFFY